MLLKNELDNGKITAMRDVKQRSFTMIKCPILKYFGGGVIDEGKQSIDPFAKALFYSGVGVSVTYETESFCNLMKSCKYILFSLQNISYVVCKSAVWFWQNQNFLHGSNKLPFC